ncbi:MAG: PAS domain S-box protein [Lunatimonas sp.]|uniref:PAS domain S-box protein n=1 Tax=Lunatimonas sp. TaxID=2060141 RepID=UPI00263B562C|nr:PAS domain S-box protein [Lunatimonas sp.]MCC5936142.1 PAS domain S-box protein [Lunatimonas sp.]
MHRPDDYNSLFFLSPLPILVYDISSFRIMDVNPAAIFHYGYSKEEFLSMTLSDLHIADQGLPQVPVPGDTDRQRKNIHFGVVTQKKKDGQRVKVDLNGHLIELEGRECVMLLVQDVTQREAEITALKLSQEKLAAASEIADIGYWRLEMDANTLTWSEKVYEIWGRRKEEFPLNFDSFYATIHPDDREHFDREQEETFSGRKDLNFVHRILLPDGTVRWVSEVGRLNRDATGQPIAFEGIVKDITQEMNEELEKDLFTRIGAVFSEFENMKDALSEMCKLINQVGGFSFTEVWLPSVHRDRLRLSSKAIGDEAGSRFYQLQVQEYEFLPGQGLPGKVWEGLKAIYCDKPSEANYFIRRLEAQEAGIKTVLSIPLLQKGELIGVLMVGSADLLSNIQQYQPVLKKLELFLGSEILRKRLENERLHLVESLPDLVGLLDFSGLFIRINSAGCRILGYPDQGVVGRSLWDFLHPEDRTNLADQLQQARQGERTIKFEARIIHKAGQVVCLAWHGSVLQDQGVIFVSAKDVTEERDLKEVISNASELAQIGGWSIDLVNQKLFWSKEIHRIYDTDPAIYQPDLDSAIAFYRSDYVDRVNASFEQAIREGISFDLVAAIISASGTEKWVRVIGKPEMLDGECIRIFGSFQDISSLKAIQQRLENITNDLPGVTFQYFLFPDGSHKLESVSRGSEQIWHLTPEQCEADSQSVWRQISNGGDIETLTQEIKESMANLTQWHSRWRNLLPNGQMRWHEGFGTPYRLPDGTILFNSMIFDITEEVKSVKLTEEIADLAKIGSWELDLTPEEGANAMYWSPMVKQLLEVEDSYSPSLTGGFEFYTEESRERIQNAVAKLINEGLEFDEELLLITASGREQWVRCIGKCEEVGGKRTKIFGSFQDIHAMKSTQLQLKEILGSISDAFYAVDRDWNFTYFNREAENLLDRKSEELIGRNIWEEFAPAKGTAIETIYRRVATSGQFERFEYFYPGNNCWFEVTTYPSGGGVSSYFRNIDERIKSEQALRQAFEEKNRILESVGDAFFALDQDAQITYWNNKAEEVTGLRRDEMIGYNFWKRLPEVKKLPFLSRFKDSLVEKRPMSVVEYVESYDHWFEVNIYPTPEGVSVFFRNITEQKKAEERLRLKNTQLDIISEMNSELLSYEDWFKVIARAFQKVGTSVHVDRIYYFQNSLNEETGEMEASQRLEWTKEGVTAQINNPDLQHMPFSVIYDFVEPLTKNRPFMAIIRKMEDTKTKELLAEQGIKSILVLPIFLKNLFWGFIGFDDCQEERRWNEDDITFLRTITANLSSAIEANQTHLELARAYEERNLILETIGDAFFAVDNSWKVTYWNAQAERFLNKPKADIVGRNLWDEYSNAIDSEFYRKYHQAKKTKQVVTFEDYFEPMDRWFEVTAYPNDLGLSVYFKDVTLRKKSDIRVREANERFEKVAQATTDAIWDWDIAGDVYFRGEGFEKLFGYDVKRNLRKRDFWKDSFHPDDVIQVKESLESALADPNQEYWQSDYRIKHASGEIKYVIDKGIIIRNAEGKPTRMVGATTDITDTKRHEMELREINERLVKYTRDLEISNEQLEHFAFITSHDLQEPLRMITSFLNQLQKKYQYQLDDKAHQYIHFAVDGAKRMKQIILDVLEFSRAGTVHEIEEVVHLDELIAEYRALRRKLLEERNAKIHTGYLPVVTCFKAPLTQTLHCLMDNAIKYSRDGVPPEITLSVVDKGDFWQFSIQDNGIGIEPRFFEKIFVIFQRLHNRDSESGTGVGLPIAKKQVESWGGRIWVESQPGIGSTFYFTVNKKTHEKGTYFTS